MDENKEIIQNEKEKQNKNENKNELKLDKLIRLNKKVNEDYILELPELIGSTKKRIFRSFLSGIFRGIGMGIGFSIVTGIIIYSLQNIIKLNIPVISQYISDVVEIVQKTK